MLRHLQGSGDLLRQALINLLIQRTALRPITHEPRTVLGIRRGEAGGGGVLAHRIKVDQRPAVLVPEQVVALEVTMADALADQFGEQVIQRLQFVFRRFTAFNIRREAFDDVRARQVFGDQVRAAAQPEKRFSSTASGFGVAIPRNARRLPSRQECQARLGRQKRLSQWAKPLML